MKRKRDAAAVWARRTVFVALGMLVWSALVGSLCAQLVRGFVFPEYYETRELGKGQTNRLKGKITGKSATVLQAGIYLLEMPEIQRNGEDGRTNLTARSPECVFDQKRQMVSSTNRLAVEAGNGQLLIEGEGFLCYVTNFNLTLSNRVWTLIRQDMLQTSRRAKSRASGVVAPEAARTNVVESSGTNSDVQIFSDHLEFYHQAGVAVYSGNVRVENAQMDLACDTLTIHRSTNGTIESILAETNVVMVNKLDKSRASGDRGDYQWEEERETIVLTGADAHWQDPQREGKARRFVFDLRSNTVQAEQNAWMKVPRAAMNQTDLLATRPATNAPTSLTNQFVEIASEFLFIELPTTNRPARSITARTNVVILSPADKSRATGDQAFFSESTGVMELIGDAAWLSDQRLMKGNSLFYDRTNRIFRADGNAFLKMPASQLGRRNVRSSQPARTNLVVQEVQPQFVEVFADSYDFQSGYITFHENVRARLYEGETPQAALTCDLLSIKLSNQVEMATAKGHVFAEEFPVPATNAATIRRDVKCETLTLNFSTNGLVQKIMADQNVEARQWEMPRDKPPVESQLNAEVLTAYYFSHTNQLREAVAERKVTLRQNQTLARGDKAVYTGTNNVVELTGNPTAEVPQGRITEAEILVWDRTLEKFFVKQFKAQAEVLPTGTNRSNLPSRK